MRAKPVGAGTESAVEGARSHPHPHDPATVAAAQKRIPAPDASAEVAGLFRLLGDPTRTRITFALRAVDELCVGDIALAIGANENAVSYALGQLRAAGFVDTRRAGRIVYYRLSDQRLQRLVDAAIPDRGPADPASMPSNT